MTTTLSLPLARRRRRRSGQRLKEARIAAGLSQRQLAFPGCSAAYISRLEAGQRVASLQLLRRIAAKLGVDEEFLATGVARPHPLPAELVEADVALRMDDLDTARDHYERALRTNARPTRASRGARRPRAAGASPGRSWPGGRLDRGGASTGAVDRVRVPGVIRDAGQGVRREGRAGVRHRRLRARGCSGSRGGRSARAGALRDLARERAHRQRQLRAGRRAARRRPGADPVHRRSRAARADLLVAVAAAHAQGKPGRRRPVRAEDARAARARRGRLQHRPRSPAPRVHRGRARARRRGARMGRPWSRLARRGNRASRDGAVPDRGGPRTRAPQPHRGGWERWR